MKLKSMIWLLVGSLVIVAAVYSLLSVKAIAGVVSELRVSTAQAQQYAAAINISRQAQVNFQRQVQEWKDILIRGNEPESYDKHLKGFAAREQSVDEGLAELKTLFAGLALDVAPIDALLDEHRKLGAIYREALASFQAADRESGKKVDKLLRGVDRPASKAMDELAAKVEQEADAKLSLAKSESEAASRDAYLQVSAVTVASLLLTVGLCWKIGMDVLRTVGGEPADLTKSFSFIARGNLSNEIPLRGGDEASLAAQAKLMQMRVRTMVVAIKQGVVEFAAAADRAGDAESAAEVADSLKSAKKAMTALGKAADRFTV
jgi:methyl-accepting chemotaxis protein